MQSPKLIAPTKIIAAKCLQFIAGILSDLTGLSSGK
jgi:hypothetical protein